MGVREQVTSVAAYGLVALASAMVVSGGTLGEAIRGVAQSVPKPPTAVAGTRVTAAPAGSARPAAGLLPGALEDIPGANGATAPSADAAAPIAAVPVPTVPAAAGRAPAVPAAPVRAAPRTATPAPVASAVSETGSSELDATLRLARSLTQQWYDSSLQTIWASFSPDVKAQWKSFGDFQSFRAGGRRAYGAETAVLAEELTPHGTVTYYTRTASFERGPKDGWTLIIGLDAAGQVRDFGVVGASLLPARMNAVLR